MKTAPAFQFYASDTMADKRYRLMDLTERGLLLTLYCECWVNHGVPADLQRLAKYLGFAEPEIRAALTERVMSFFEAAEGELRSAELDRYRKTLEERRTKMAEGGKRGARGKWKGHGHPNALPDGVSMASRVEMNRSEARRGESIESVVSSVVDPWVDEYERASTGD